MENPRIGDWTKQYCFQQSEDIVTAFLEDVSKDCLLQGDVVVPQAVPEPQWEEGEIPLHYANMVMSEKMPDVRANRPPLSRYTKPERTVESGLFYDDCIEEVILDVRKAAKQQEAKNFSGLPEDVEKLFNGKSTKIEMEIKHYCKLAETKFDSPLSHVRELSKSLKDSLASLEKLSGELWSLKNHFTSVTRQVDKILNELENPS